MATDITLMGLTAKGESIAFLIKSSVIGATARQFVLHTRARAEEQKEIDKTIRRIFK